jgi:hypothetical protein
MFIHYALLAVAAFLTLAVVVTFPQIVRDACHPEPPILTPTARKFCRMLYEANRAPGPRLVTPTGHLHHSWMKR